MENYLCVGALCFLLYTLVIPFPASGCLLSEICGNNQNADALIHGDSINAVNNFVGVVSKERWFELYGDNENHTGGCRQPAGSHRHRQREVYDGMDWILDCWDPLECTMLETVSHGMDQLKLIPFSGSSSGLVSVKTVLLPIDEINTVSYTFLPAATHKSMFLVTSLLSGCSVFIAKPDKPECNIIVMHTNYFCGSQNQDYNHKQAMATLQMVNRMNSRCSYHPLLIQRWAADTNRDIIIAGHYPYEHSIFFYSMKYVNFLYGYRVGGGKLHFCIKEVRSGPPKDSCVVS